MGWGAALSAAFQLALALLKEHKDGELDQQKLDAVRATLTHRPLKKQEPTDGKPA